MADHALATVTNPTSALTDFTLIVDLSDMPASWWSAVDTSDGTRGRVYKGDGTTRLAADWIDFDDTAETGLLRVLWSGTLASTGTQQLWIEPPVSGNATVAEDNTYGSDNAYDSDWAGYWPDGGVTDRTANSLDLTGLNITAGDANGPIGAATTYNGSDAGAYASQSAVDTRDFTILGWFKPDNVTGNMTIAVISDVSSKDRYAQLAFRGGDSGDPVKAVCRQGAFEGPETTTGASVSTWHHAAGRYHTTDEATVYIDAGSSGNQNNLAEFSAGDIDAIIIGALGRVGIYVENDFFDGMLSEIQLHSTDRSAGWISHEYDQTSDNSTFWGAWSWESAGGTTQELVGALTATSALSGAIEIIRSISGSLTGQSATDAAIEVSRALTGASTGQAGISGVLEIVRTLSGALAGQSQAVGSVEVARALSGALTSASQLSGGLETSSVVNLAGSLESASGISGDALIERALSGTLSGQSEAAAAIEVVRQLSGVLAGQSEISGDLIAGAVFNEIFSIAVQWSSGLVMPVKWGDE